MNTHENNYQIFLIRFFGPIYSAQKRSTFHTGDWQSYLSEKPLHEAISLHGHSDTPIFPGTLPALKQATETHSSMEKDHYTVKNMRSNLNINSKARYSQICVRLC